MSRPFRLHTLVTLIVLLAVVGPPAFAFVATGAESPASTPHNTGPVICSAVGTTDATGVGITPVHVHSPKVASAVPVSLIPSGVAVGSPDGAFIVADGDAVPPGVLLTAGFSRRGGSDPLENEVRRRIYEAIEDRPGSYVSEIAEETDIPRSTVRYHVRVLNREGLVFDEKIRGKRRFFPAGSDGVELTAALEDEATGAVFDAVARLAPASVSEVASSVDRTPATVSYHLSRLESAGLVERERDGNAVLNRIATDLDPGDAEKADADRAEATS